jgi:hypothetical protein
MKSRFAWIPFVFALVMPVAISPPAFAVVLSNPICLNNTANYSPGTGKDIVVPPGFKVSVFASGLNFPVGIAFSCSPPRALGAVMEQSSCRILGIDAKGSESQKSAALETGSVRQPERAAEGSVR